MKIFRAIVNCMLLLTCPIWGGFWIWGMIIWDQMDVGFKGSQLGPWLKGQKWILA